jgi:hypothetical protein
MPSTQQARSGVLTFGICTPAYIHDMDQRIRMSQVIQKLISESLALVRTRDQSRDIE